MVVAVGGSKDECVMSDMSGEGVGGALFPCPIGRKGIVVVTAGGLRDEPVMFELSAGSVHLVALEVSIRFLDSLAMHSFGGFVYLSQVDAPCATTLSFQ